MSVRHTLFALAAISVTALAVSPVSSQTLRYANQGELKSLDPYTLNESTTHAHLGQVYEGLIARDKDLKIVPALAESWAVSADGKTVTLEIRPGLKFADGSPLELSDIKWSLDRASNKETGGGKKSGSGRGKKESHASSRKGGRKGGSASAHRSAAARSRSARKAAATRKRRGP